MKQKLISFLITAGARLDTFVGVIFENQGLLVEIGIDPKITKIIMLLGLIWVAFNKPLLTNIYSDDIGGGGIKNPPPPPNI